jgi:acyl-coenzyme A synthetase/AMP-(fatty) acid ligase
LAEGYWQDEARSFSAFRPLEIGGDIFRGYFTGDWVERVSKNLFFRERIDAQVKILGYRIELDEVAGAIRACGFANACVFKRGEALAALVECPTATQFDASALRADLARHIEPYAIPAHLHAVEKLPRNENDKIDRAASITLFEQLNVEVDTR